MDLQNNAVAKSSNMMLSIITIFLTVFILRSAYIYIKSLRTNSPPLIGGYFPFIGCSLQFLLNPVGFINNAREKYGSVFTMHIAGLNITMCTDISHIKLFYNSKEDQVSLYGAVSTFFSCVLPIDVDKLSVFDAISLKKLKTAQHKIFPNMHQYLDTMIERTNKYFDEKESYGFYNYLGTRGKEQGLVDLYNILPPLIVSVNSMCIVAPELSLPQYYHKFIACIRTMDETLESTALHVHKNFQWLHPSSRKAYSAFRELASILRDILIDRIDFRQERLDILKLTSMDEFGEDLMYDANFLKSVFDNLETRNKMYAMTARIFSLVYAGGTVSKSVASCMIDLLRRPEYMKRVKEEQAHCKEKYSDLLTQLSEMHFLEACINETCRRTTGPIVIRKLQKPLSLPQENLVIPQGHLMAISPYLLHHDPSTHKDPYVYDPSRWLNNNTDTTPGRVFHAFGGGSHACVGMKMAIVETKVIMGALLERFDWEITNEVSPPDFSVAGLAKPVVPCILKYTRKQL
ncbi:sterol 14-alpha-demethylase [Acrasis kona]|uniref:Sterol 14-alpha-demethylase n=1 Tax=Acrasis kona TaxID=1008807 RepID=A0AAW2ZM64_9EUKA